MIGVPSQCPGCGKVQVSCVVGSYCSPQCKKAREKMLAEHEEDMQKILSEQEDDPQPDHIKGDH